VDSGIRSRNPFQPPIAQHFLQNERFRKPFISATTVTLVRRWLLAAKRYDRANTTITEHILTDTNHLLKDI
jgi:hypothetical protein